MRRTARAVGLSFLVLLITLPWANAAQAPSLEVSRWSRPVAVIMTRIEARPGLVVDRSGRIHLFYLDREGDRGLVLWVTTDVDGRTSHPPRVLGVADLRANTLGAAGGDQAIQIMWVAPSGDGMRVVGARVAAGGAGPENPRMMPVPLGPQVEDAGPVSLVASRDGVHAVWSQARELPFRDGWFDMVFTVGVLIHQPPETLPVVMAEIVRCSRRYVLCGEYFAEEPTEVPYREQKGALFKRDFGGLYCRLFPGFVVRQQGFLSRAEGWDDITYWVLERTDR